MLLLLVSRGGLTSGPLDKMKGGESEDEVVSPLSPTATKRRGPGIEVDLRGVDRQTAGNPPGIGLCGGVPPRISPGARSGGCEGAAEEVSHRVVGGVAVWACGVSGPAYRVAVGLEHLALAGLKLGEGTSEDRGSSYPAGSIGSNGGWIRALCWVPMTERSPLSSGLVGAVWPGDECPLSGNHQRGEEGRLGRHLFLISL